VGPPRSTADRERCLCSRGYHPRPVASGLHWKCHHEVRPRSGRTAHRRTPLVRSPPLVLDRLHHGRAHHRL